MDPILDQVRRLMARWQKYELIALDDNLQAWKRTVIHQTFMLLHEFGHIALGHMTRQQRSRSFTGLFRKDQGDQVLVDVTQ